MPAADVAPEHARTALAAKRNGDNGALSDSLKKLASSLSARVGVSAAVLVAAWASATPDHLTVMLSALTQLGVPYSFNAAAPQVAFDCSGLTSWAWAQAGVSLPHQSLITMNRIAPVILADVKPGDLLYYPGHIMIALGVGDAIVHASNSSTALQATALRGRHAAELVAGDPTP